MVETIGKPGMCVYSTDREEILIALDNLLEMRNKDYQRIKNEITKKGIIKPQDAFKHPTIIILGELIKKTEMVRDRVLNTSEC